MSGPSRPRAWTAATLVAGTAAGFLFVTSAVSSHGVDLRASSVTDLTTYLISQRQQVNDLQAQVARENAQITALTAGLHDSRVSALQPQLQALQRAAGFTPVTGPGVTITLQDAPKSVINRAQQSGSVPVDWLLVHQQDIQAVVNALWSGGASAISVQGQRITAITGIKCVGNTVVLRGVPYAPPYVIQAVGNVDQLINAIDTSEYVAAYQTVVKSYQLGWMMTTAPTLTIPAYTGVSDLTSARVDTQALQQH